MKLAEDLRRSVLQAAIEGKLTGGSREGWRFVRLGDVTYNHGQKKPDCDFYYINVGSVDNKRCQLGDNDILISPDKASSRARKIIKQDDVIYALIRPYLHNICIVNRNYSKEVIASTAFAVMHCREEILTRYLYYVLLSPMFDRYANAPDKSRGIAYPAIGERDFFNGTIPLPPIDEQRRIVSRLDAILPLIAGLESAENELAELERRFPGDMRDSLLQAAIEGRLTGSNTDNWRYVRLGEISLSIQYGYNAPAREEGIVKMIRITDIQHNNIQWDNVPYCEISEDEMQKYLLAKNDILFARTGGTVGKSYLVSDLPEKAIYAGYLIRMRLCDEIDPQYVKYFMESESYWKQLRNGTTATAQPNCNGNTLSQMIIPLPPIDEQKRIVTRLNELLPLCDALENLS